MEKGHRAVSTSSTSSMPCEEMQRQPRRWPRLRCWVAEERLTGNSTFNKHDHVYLQAEFELTLQIHDSCNNTVAVSPKVSPCAHFSCPPLISTPATNGRLPTCTQHLQSPNLPAPSFATCPILCLDLGRLRVIKGLYIIIMFT